MAMRHFYHPLATGLSCVVLAGCNAASPSLDASSFGIGSGWAFPSNRVAATDGTKGMVSSTDRVASEVGVEILRRGGNLAEGLVVHDRLATSLRTHEAQLLKYPSTATAFLRGGSPLDRCGG